MGTFIDSMVMIGFFFLRLGVPLLLVIGVGYILRRLDAKWEAEVWEQAGKTTQPTVQPTIQPGIQPEIQPTVRPAPRPVQRPSSQAVRLLTAEDIFGQPCWDIKDCSPEMAEHCPATAQPDLPCWLAKQESEGQLPKECYNCSIYIATQWPQQTWPQQVELPH